MQAEPTAPILFNPVLAAARLKTESPAFAQGWDAQAQEFDALGALLAALKRARLTQAQVVEAMGVKQPRRPR